MNNTFSRLLNEYPQLQTKQGLIAFVQEYSSKTKLCYPFLKDTQTWLELAGVCDEHIAIMKAYIEQPMSWQPMKDYHTFGHFLAAHNLGECQLAERVENMVHEYQLASNISSLVEQHETIRGKVVKYSSPHVLKPTDSDKVYLKNDIRRIVSEFIELASDDYQLVSIDWEHELSYGNGHEVEVSKETILGACMFAQYATIHQESYMWEGNIGKACRKHTPDRILLYLNLGFDFESTLIEFRAVNKSIDSY